jgi:hypothetical protein
MTYGSLEFRDIYSDDRSEQAIRSSHNIRTQCSVHEICKSGCITNRNVIFFYPARRGNWYLWFHSIMDICLLGLLCSFGECCTLLGPAALRGGNWDIQTAEYLCCNSSGKYGVCVVNWTVCLLNIYSCSGSYRVQLEQGFVCKIKWCVDCSMFVTSSFRCSIHDFCALLSICAAHNGRCRLKFQSNPSVSSSSVKRRDDL